MTTGAPTHRDPAARLALGRSAARRGALVTGAGGVGAVGLGVAAVAFPPVLLGVVAVPLVLLVPLVPVLIGTLSDGIVFPLLLTGRGSSLLNIGVLATTLMGLAAVLLRGTVNPRIARFALAVLALALPGLLVALDTEPVSQVLSGARYLAVPIVMAMIASTLGSAQLRVLLKCVTALMSVSAVAAAIEQSLGSDRLLALTGLAYGVSIRNFGSALRAPGTFATNFHLGAYASVVAVIALLWWGTLEGARRDWPWRVVALGASLACLALSTYRTGVVLLVVSVVAAIFLSGGAVKTWVRLLVAGLGAVVAIGFVAVGLGNTNSFFQRLGVWGDLLAGRPGFLGRGVGYSGAASGAAGSARQIFTDNYYISLWLQLGLPGVLIAVLLIGVAVHLYRAGSAGSPRAAVAVALWCGALVAFFFVELWEYTSAMSLIAVVIGASAARPPREGTLP